MNKLDLYLNYWEAKRISLFGMKSACKKKEYNAVCLFGAHLREIKNDFEQ